MEWKAIIDTGLDKRGNSTSMELTIVAETKEDAKQQIMKQHNIHWSQVHLSGIRPHKGGRTLTIRARVTPSEKELIDNARGDDSYSDYFISKALNDVRRKNK